MPRNTDLRKLKKLHLFRENDINIALNKQTIGEQNANAIMLTYLIPQERFSCVLQIGLEDFAQCIAGGVICQGQKSSLGFEVCH